MRGLGKAGFQAITPASERVFFEEQAIRGISGWQKG